MSDNPEITGIDDGEPWGWVCDGTWRPIPKTPLLLGGYGPPPFTVTTPMGETRRIVHQPDPNQYNLAMAAIEAAYPGINDDASCRHGARYADCPTCLPTEPED
jgi:hypothetical protein